MRIDELSIALKSLGKRYNRDFCVEAGNENVIVFWRLDGWTRMAEFSTKKQLFFKGYEDVFLLLPEDLIDDLTEVFIDFLTTPIPEREEKQRYYYVVKDIYRWILKNEKEYYLYYDDEDCEVFMGGENDDVGFYAINTFTDDDIKELVSIAYIVEDMFEKVEVK